MGTILNLSIVGMVVTFLLGVLMAFPLPGGADGSYEDGNADEGFSFDRIRRIGELFTGAYTSTLDEMIVHQTAPDYARAEAERQNLVEYSGRLAGDFEEFTSELETEFGSLQIEADQITASPTPAVE
jgi:hypothetical protein